MSTELTQNIPGAVSAAPDGRDVPLLMSIDQDGKLQVGDAEDPTRYLFAPNQVLALGDFLALTERVWRP